jgi:aspartate racemase
MHTPSLAEYVKHLQRDDWQAVGELMLASANKLATIGADFLIGPITQSTRALPLVAKRSPLPWLHIAEIVVAEAAGARIQMPRLRERAGWSTARSIRRSWPRAD